MVKIIIDNVYSKIAGFLPEEVQNDLYDSLAFKVQGARFIPIVIDGKWDGVMRFYKRHQGQAFFTGLLGFVRDVLEKHGIEYEKDDRRICPDQNLPNLQFLPPEDYEERDYQAFTVDRALTFTRGILSSCTASGKTMMVTKLISRIKTYPFIYYVLTKDLMEQAYDTLSTCLNEPIGRIGDGKVDIKKISVCTIQTAIRALNVRNSKFKISDYKFDDEDVWDEHGIEDASKAEKLQKLIKLTKGIYFDECVCGDTKVITEKGEMRIDKIPENGCKFVLSYDGNNIVYKQIIKWMDKGEKKIIEIRFDKDQIVKCTAEHLVYTQKGWKEAGKLKIGEKVLGVNEAFLKCGKILKNISLPVCNTNWQTIKNIAEGNIEKVYDISVKDTHCFFGNKTLVHNCHHASSKTATDVMSASVNAYWRFGGSATPYRDDGADIVIQAMFGKKIVDISASYLIKRDFLLPPHIFFVPIDKATKYRSYAKIYSKSIAHNDEFNTHVANLANHFMSRGLSTLILVKQYAQGNYIKNLMPNVPFLTGKMTSTARKKHINNLRTRESLGMIATTLADEGLDIPTLDVVIMAGGGASATRINQRIGRTIRKDRVSKNPRDKSIVIIYEHDARFLTKHSEKIRRLLKKEKEFVLHGSAGSSSIFNDVDKLLGFEPKNPTLFDAS